MSNFTYSRRRWAAIPLDLLLNPTVSLAAKAVAGILFAADQMDHQTLSFLSEPLNLSPEDAFFALEELEAHGIIRMEEEDGRTGIYINIP